MVYPRRILPALEAELETKEATVITGMRRVGKTTVLMHLYERVPSKNKAYFDLENPLHRKVFEEEQYDAVWNNLKQFGIGNDGKSYIFLDEVQNLPNVTRVIKYLYDHWDVKFILTGSSSYYLRNLFPESLAGRKVIFEMYPLTFSEFLVFHEIRHIAFSSWREKAAGKNAIRYAQIAPYYKEYLEFGGFPGVVLEKNRERKRVLLSEIFTSYFEKDAKNLADFREMSKLRDLILILVPRTGSRIEVAKIASELGVSRETVYNYLAFLEKTYFISLLTRYSASIDRQAAGGKKVFFCDSGIVNVLGRVSQGQLFEQSVFQNLRPRHTLSFYSKDSGHEIDFVVDNSCALEVKTTASRRDVANLVKRVIHTPFTEKYIVSSQFSADPDVIVGIDV